MSQPQTHADLANDLPRLDAQLHRFCLPTMTLRHIRERTRSVLGGIPTQSMGTIRLMRRSGNWWV
ncbi:hypothetical protein V2I59_16590 [Pseudomonas viridiflava]|uniref:hypothetical protein n=1 Tax=Pseudomonas viridiflava TaxID=33069 RepID=UPI000F04EB2E|nr:hypothetical protein [Pseudomonas viridiflava]MEE4095153.1 hypothetical protein [Pseudomonas viridiflava]